MFFNSEDDQENDQFKNITLQLKNTWTSFAKKIINLNETVFQSNNVHVS